MEFKDILQAKIEHYGETKFAYESACDEYIKSRTTHPSDSDIEKEAYKYGEQNVYPENPAIAKFCDNAFYSGVKWMRDRMNGEMCEFLVWAVTNYDWHFVYWTERKNPNTEYTTEQLLQKFRNR